ncbi:hypothetical protein PVAP13_5KG397407 [Panicum virgatum]|uniref:Uncharacterized protein n=1 Tax=Panicum virgatum TaxID=38727 RepID=A0A8T0SRI4_PANVG|nr:hypothetical protein PVAP13_5KG397407 [Panicum virgatum]
MEEYTALLANQIWDLVPCPSGCNVVTSVTWTRLEGAVSRVRYVSDTAQIALQPPIAYPIAPDLAPDAQHARRSRPPIRRSAGEEEIAAGKESRVEPTCCSGKNSPRLRGWSSRAAGPPGSAPSSPQGTEPPQVGEARATGSRARATREEARRLGLCRFGEEEAPLALDPYAAPAVAPPLDPRTATRGKEGPEPDPRRPPPVEVSPRRSLVLGFLLSSVDGYIEQC